jgi:predicted phage tail protein
MSGPSNEVAFALVPFGCNAAPRAPAGLSGTASREGATLEWGDAIGAASYLVEAGSQPGAADIAILDMGSRLSLQTSAPPGRYFVRARGVNSCGRGAASNEVVLTVGGPPLGAPSNLTAQVSGRTVTLAWDAPTSGEVPAFYQLEAGSSSGAADVAVARQAERILVATGVAPGTYYVRVRAGNAAGLSAPTADVAVTITP